MEKYIALLRGINVSGKNSIKMDRLKEVLNKLNLVRLQTYIQSGNLVFSSLMSKEIIVTSIQNTIKEHFQYDIPVLIYTKEEMQMILDSNPYKTLDSKQMYYTFLQTTPLLSEINFDKLKKNTDEQVEITEKVIYIHCPTGYGKTKLTNVYFEKLTHTICTTRNRNTCEKLIAFSEQV